MPAKRLGWSIYLGVSNTTITNGMYSDEFGPKNLGGDGTLVADIDVYVPELTPNADGKEADAKRAYDIALTNPFTDQVEQRQVTFTNVIRCKYMGRSNEIIPCVHKGEQVWVLQHEGGEFSYYWLPMGRDEGIRNREHIRWFAHNVPKCVVSEGRVVVVDDDNTYFIDINTNKEDSSKHGTGKLFQIHTAKNDGEAYSYDIRIFPEHDILEICDSADSVIAGDNRGPGNRIELNSRETRWTIRNIDDSFIKLDKENITISCKDTIRLVAGKKIHVRGGWYDDYTTGVKDTPLAALGGIIDVMTGTHLEVEETKTEDVHVLKTENLKASIQKIDTTKVQTIGASKTIVVPLTTNTGVFNNIGAMTQTGITSIIGATTFTGVVIINDPARITPALTVNGGNGVVIPSILTPNRVNICGVTVPI